MDKITVVHLYNEKSINSKKEKLPIHTIAFQNHRCVMLSKISRTQKKLHILYFYLHIILSEAKLWEIKNQSSAWEQGLILGAG